MRCNGTKGKCLIKCSKFHKDQNVGQHQLKGDGHVDCDFPLVSKVKCAKFHQHFSEISSRSETRATPELQLVQFLISKTTASVFTTTCERFTAIG